MQSAHQGDKKKLDAFCPHQIETSIDLMLLWILVTQPIRNKSTRQSALSWPIEHEHPASPWKHSIPGCISLLPWQPRGALLCSILHSLPPLSSRSLGFLQPVYLAAYGSEKQPGCTTWRHQYSRQRLPLYHHILLHLRFVLKDKGL